jgi:PAS domain S-box-containing protein
MKIDPAIHFMVFDMLKEILTLADKPSRMGEYITRQARELVACKMVVLIGHDHELEHRSEHHSIISICPERMKKDLNKKLLLDIAEHSHELKQTTIIEHSSKHEISILLQNFGGELSAIVPLLYSDTFVGVLLMVGITDRHNIQSTIESLDALAGVLALEIRNASFYEKLEEKVELRTKQLIDTELQFKEIFNSTSEAIFIDDAETGQMIDSNQRAVEMYGYSSKEELINQPIGGISANIEPYTNEIAQEKVNMAIKGEAQTFEWLARKKNDEVFWAEVSLKSSKIGGKKRVIAVVRDISERKNSEEKIKSVNQELRAVNEELATQNEEYLALNEELQESLKHINKINRELEEAKEKAEESDRLKTNFLANMSHEIRTPMNSIMGFASLLPDEDNSKLMTQYAQIILNSSEQLVHIIDDIVLYSKLQTKLFRINTHNFKTTKLLADVYQSFNLPDYQHNTKLIIDNSCKELSINSDYDKIKQLLNNLISNAFKYTPEGEIHIGYELVCKELIFHVKDTGMGIPKNEIEKVFERFYRGSNVNKNSISGTGLGLSIAKELIDLLKGRIWIESEPGIGTTFYFSVPVE